MALIRIGTDTFIPTERIVAIVENSDGQTLQKVLTAKKNQKQHFILEGMTKALSVIFMTNGEVCFSKSRVETLADRIENTPMDEPFFPVTNNVVINYEKLRFVSKDLCKNVKLELVNTSSGKIYSYLFMETNLAIATGKSAECIFNFLNDCISRKLEVTAT